MNKGKCLEVKKNILSGTYLSGSGFMKFKNTVFIICASLFASIGLLYNSIPVLLGSMLISPIGSPIFRGIVGILSNQYKIFFQSILSLLILVLIAYATGILTGILNCYTNYFKYPTEEMINRTEIKNVYGDIMVALIAGVLVSFGMYYKDLIVIVGIGLAISILPPIVNSGLYSGIYLYEKYIDNNDLNEINMSHDEMLKKASTSFNLGIINIICIFITSLITLYLLCL